MTLTILTFFILSSLSLTRQQAIDVKLPPASAGAREQTQTDRQ